MFLKRLKYSLLNIVILFFILLNLPGCFAGKSKKKKLENKKGTIVILNGTSSSGKSSIAKIFKEKYGYEYFSFDNTFYNSAAEWFEQRVLKLEKKYIKLPRNNPDAITRDTQKIIDKLKLKEEDYDFGVDFTKNQYVEFEINVFLKTLEDAKQYSLAGKNVVVDVVWDNFRYKEKLDGFDYITVLVYCKLDKLLDRVRTRNTISEVEQRSFKQAFSTFEDFYKERGFESEILLDQLSRNDFEKACELVKSDFRIDKKIELNEESNFKKDKYNEFINKIKINFGFDNKEIESVKITPKLSHDLIVNTGEFEPDVCAENIKNFVESERLKEWPEITRNGETVAFRVYNKEKLLDEKFIESLRQIWLDASFSAYIENEIKENPDSSKELVEKNLKEFLNNNWPKNGFLKTKKGKACFDVGIYPVVAFKNEKPVAFVFFVNDLVNENGEIHNILKLNEKWIEPIMVHPEAQNLGLGRSLAFSILKFLPDTERIIVKADKENDKACNFYERIGFKKYQQDKYEYDKDEEQFFEWIKDNN
ncbi:GNAT family N-acetyltransferase [Candidatus Dependentiae bacterium]|nr:GNAT family N-acetyltransferase [Candidatus Dependentiae bacterium]MBU4387458.1 GNAT family N-acetyltransferase [Candidatus Dependentiae bacterium]MCG2756161.1 GNAT family N-acetyltransferase [Candidatus Dependentiae bacterium]